MTFFSPSSFDQKFPLMGELRLCAQHAPAGGPAATPGKGMWEKAWEGLGDVTTEVTAWIGKTVVSPAIDFVQGVSRSVWEKMPSREAVADFLRKTEEFFFSIPPGIVNLIKKIHIIPDKETAERLINHMEWINAFDAADVFTALKTDVPSENFGPRDLLLGEQEETRTAIYLDFVGGMIPENVRKMNEFKSLFGDTGADLTSIVKEKKTILTSMKYFLGEEDANNTDDVPAKLAKSVIEDRYFTEEKVEVGTGSEQSTQTLRLYRAGLKADYQRMRRYHPEFTASQLQSPELLRAPLPPSILRGALRMGIVGQSDLENLRRSYEHEMAGRSAQAVEIGRNLDLAFLRNEAESIENVWGGMNGIEKLVLIAAAIAAATKWRGAAIGVAAAYFGRKFFFNDPNPLNTFGDLARKGVSMVKGLGEGFLGRFGMEPEHAPREYGDLMLTFMHEDVREDLAEAAEGFGLLARTPLGALAQSITVDPSGGSGTFDIANGTSWNRDSALYGAIKEQFSRRKLDRRRVEAFFLRGDRAEQNRADVVDALTHVFYMIAASKPKNFDRMQVIERAADRLGAGQGYDEIEDETARTYYRDLVLEGQWLAANGEYAKKSLVDLIAEMRGVGGREPEAVAKQEGPQEDKPTENTYNATPAANTASDGAGTNASGDSPRTQSSTNDTIPGVNDASDSAQATDNPSVTNSSNASPEENRANGDSRREAADSDQTPNSADGDVRRAPSADDTQMDTAPDAQGNAASDEAGVNAAEGDAQDDVAGEAENNSSSEAERGTSGEAQGRSSADTSRSSAGEGVRSSAETGTDKSASGEANKDEAPDDDATPRSPSETQSGYSSEEGSTRTPDTSQSRSASETSGRESGEASKVEPQDDAETHSPAESQKGTASESLGEEEGGAAKRVDAGNASRNESR